MPTTLSSPTTYPPGSSPPRPVQKRQLVFTRKQPHIESSEEYVVDGVQEPGRPAKRQALDTTIRRQVSAITHLGDGRAKANPLKSYSAFLDIDSEDEDTQVSQLPCLSSTTYANQDMFDKADIRTPAVDGRPLSNFSHHREVRTCVGRLSHINSRVTSSSVSYEQMVADRSAVKIGRAKRSYYGIDIQELIRDAKKELAQRPKQPTVESEIALPSVESATNVSNKKSLLWTEKYRAKRFLDLVGDDRTHRDVLRWLKEWDPIVFGKSTKRKLNAKRVDNEEGEKVHRKILMLTGRPGLGKTTLAHVCALQAGYEVVEINASDDRTARIVKERIRTSVDTESVKNLGTSSRNGSKIVRPTAVIIDEVDGVTMGSGESGEGGFIKALLDLISLDLKNASGIASTNAHSTKKNKKVDDFRLKRPIILICNDVYHPSLRPLRQSNHAEIVHVRKPPIDAVVDRMQTVFEKEGVSVDKDGVRKLCEAAWGISSSLEGRHDFSGIGEGDIRSVLVMGEWVATRLRAAAKPACLTRRWIEQNVLGDLRYGGGNKREGGGTKEVVSRVFITGAGFSRSPGPSTEKKDKTSLMNSVGTPISQMHANEAIKKAGMERLRELIDTSGETDRIINDLFTIYPSQPFNDDSLLSKPNAAYEWLHFSDLLTKRVWLEQDWELMPYLSQPVMACHNLFASAARRTQSTGPSYKQKWANNDTEEELLPFSGLQADHKANEAEKASRATLLELQSSLNPSLLRSFRSAEDIATDLLPYLLRMLSPDVKPIHAGGTGPAAVRKADEKEMVRRAVDIMSAIGVRYERGRLEQQFGERDIKFVYRMEP